MKWIPFEIINDVCEFTLENTFVQMRDGRILQQVDGVPMGDPTSPGMTEATLAWMEHQWLAKLPLEVKRNFAGKRYMDDILCLYADNRTWESKEFIANIERSDCYSNPLRLEPGGRTKYLPGNVVRD